MLIAFAGLAIGILISRSLIAHGTELPIPRKHRGMVINLTMHREKGLPPKYVPDGNLRHVAVPVPAIVDRPAGMP